MTTIFEFAKERDILAASLKSLRIVTRPEYWGFMGRWLEQTVIQNHHHDRDLSEVIIVAPWQGHNDFRIYDGWYEVRLKLGIDFNGSNQLQHFLIYARMASTGGIGRFARPIFNVGSDNKNWQSDNSFFLLYFEKEADAVNFVLTSREVVGTN